MDQIIITYQQHIKSWHLGIPGLYNGAPREKRFTRPAIRGTGNRAMENFTKVQRKESATEFSLQLEMSATRILA